jgi:hypothetical protein
MRGDRRVGRTLAATALAAALATSGCGAGDAASHTLGEASALPTPASAGSSEPSLAVGVDGRVYMSWHQRTEDAHELRFAVLEGERWSDARTIARGADWFVNWADFPSIVVLPDGRLAAHYLQRHGTGGTYHYDVRIVQSADGGISWGEPVQPHRDGVPAEHGFVSLFPDGERLGAVWLDGRQYDERFGGSEEMMLRFTTLGAGNELGADELIEPRICDCCQTAAVVTPRGPVVAYRGRSAEEVRDIHIARRVDGAWSTAKLHDDGWRIPGCPVNGPALAASGDRVAAAWFTAADDAPRVLAALSADAGATFTGPIQISAGDPLGRVAVAMLNDDAAAVSWLEREGEGAAILVRVAGDGELGPSIRVAATSTARASGFPRMVRTRDRLVLAWTEAGDVPQVRVATLPLQRGR